MINTRIAKNHCLLLNFSTGSTPAATGSQHRASPFRRSSAWVARGCGLQPLADLGAPCPSPQVVGSGGRAPWACFARKRTERMPRGREVTTAVQFHLVQSTSKKGMLDHIISDVRDVRHNVPCIHGEWFSFGRGFVNRLRV